MGERGVMRGVVESEEKTAQRGETVHFGVGITKVWMGAGWRRHLRCRPAKWFHVCFGQISRPGVSEWHTQWAPNYARWKTTGGCEKSNKSFSHFSHLLVSLREGRAFRPDAQDVACSPHRSRVTFCNRFQNEVAVSKKDNHMFRGLKRQKWMNLLVALGLYGKYFYLPSFLPPSLPSFLPPYFLP